MTHPDQAAIQALRNDLALQLARHVRRNAHSQIVAAKRLAIPQPTLSKIMRGNVSGVSLELMLRIAVRAGLSVVLQTGREPAEAGAYLSDMPAASPARTQSRLADEARQAVRRSVGSLSPEERLVAHLKHSEFVTALQHAARKPD